MIRTIRKSGFLEERLMYLKLVRPSCEYAEQVMQYKEDMLANNDSFDGCAGLEERKKYGIKILCKNSSK